MNSDHRAASPTFVATFADGEITRMSTWHDPEYQHLDLARGIKLSHHAYQQRTGKDPPALSAAHFEDATGVVLEHYDAKQIAEMAS